MSIITGVLAHSSGYSVFLGTLFDNPAQTIIRVKGEKYKIEIEERIAITGDIHMVRNDSGRLYLAECSSLVAVFHSSSRFFEIINRQHVRNKATML